MITCGDQIGWRELASWEGWERFNEVKDILTDRYVRGFARLEPTTACGLYLIGDVGWLAKLKKT